MPIVAVLERPAPITSGGRNRRLVRARSPAGHPDDPGLEALAEGTVTSNVALFRKVTVSGRVPPG